MNNDLHAYAAKADDLSSLDRAVLIHRLDAALRAAETDFAIANERGDDWRNKFHADTAKIEQLEADLADARTAAFRAADRLDELATWSAQTYPQKLTAVATDLRASWASVAAAPAATYPSRGESVHLERVSEEASDRHTVILDELRMAEQMGVDFGKVGYEAIGQRIAERLLASVAAAPAAPDQTKRS